MVKLNSQLKVRDLQNKHGAQAPGRKDFFDAMNNKPRDYSYVVSDARRVKAKFDKGTVVVPDETVEEEEDSANE